MMDLDMTIICYVNMLHLSAFSFLSTTDYKRPV